MIVLFLSIKNLNWSNILHCKGTYIKKKNFLMMLLFYAGFEESTEEVQGGVEGEESLVGDVQVQLQGD